MGLPEGHPEKDGVEVSISDLIPEVKKRLATKAAAEGDQGHSSTQDFGKRDSVVDGVVKATG